MNAGTKPGEDLGAEPEGRQSRIRAFRVTPLWVITVAVGVLLIVSQFAVTSQFFARSSLSTLTPLIGILVLVATGQAFVISTGGIDLSVPATITLMGTIVQKASGGANDKLAQTVLLCVVACIAIGLLNGLLVEGLRLNALVVTLAVGQLVSGFTRLYRGEVLQFTDVPPKLASAAGANVGGVSYLLMIAGGVGVLATVFLH